MRKSILVLLILSVCLIICSCGISPDQMLENFNNEIYEDVGGGVYENKDGVSINTHLIPKSVYPVNAGGQLRVEVSPAYYGYTWVLKDNSSKEEYNIKGYYIVYIGPPDVNFSSGGEYTLTLNLKNRDGVAYSDSATIKVVD